MVQTLVDKSSSFDENHLFGRNSRSRFIELGTLIYQVAKNSWFACPAEKAICVPPKKVKVLNSTPSPSLCGDILVVRQKPLPWAWRFRENTLIMPSGVIALHILC